MTFKEFLNEFNKNVVKTKYNNETFNVANKKLTFLKKEEIKTGQDVASHYYFFDGEESYEVVVIKDSIKYVLYKKDSYDIARSQPQLKNDFKEIVKTIG